MSKIVAIHQPNFFPWLGYFDKILRSDAFVFLDHVQYPKKGGLWSNRVRLLIGGVPRWVTVPIVRNYHGFRSFREMEFVSAEPWREKVVKTIVANYRKAPAFESAMPLLQQLILNEDNNLVSYNASAILAIAERLGAPRDKFFHSSELPYSGQANEMLATLTLALGGTTYMCGGGADGYQDERIFNSYGVTLRYQAFDHPRYGQWSSPNFEPGLSMIDAVMNVGWDGLRNMLGAREAEREP